MAPTHPHPGVETAIQNLLAGPIAAVADPTRDIVRKAMGRHGRRHRPSTVRRRDGTSTLGTSAVLSHQRKIHQSQNC